MALYPQILGAGDILLAILGAEAASFSVPSKILSYLAAGKPIVAAIASDNDAAKIITGAEAGFVASPNDSSAFTARVLALATDPATRHKMGDSGRAFAERNFAIEGIADRFETVFAAAIARRQGAR
jgi:glycosyltransferase involved in cell wall biosynthesis